MSKDKSISVPKNWERKMFGLEDRLSMMKELLEMFTPEAVEIFRKRRQLRRTLVFKNIIYRKTESYSKNEIPIRLTIEGQDELEAKLANVYNTKAIERFKKNRQLRNALVYMKKLFPATDEKQQVNSRINSLEDVPGIELKDYSINIAMLDYNIFKILPDIVKVYKNFRIYRNSGVSRIKGNVVITSGNDGDMHEKNGLHYQNKAIDLRSNYLTDSEQFRLANLLQIQLGKNFSVVSEHHACKDNNHIHIGYKITADKDRAHLDTEKLGDRKLINRTWEWKK